MGNVSGEKHSGNFNSIVNTLSELVFYLFFYSIHSITILHDFILKKNTFLYISNMSYKTAKKIKKLT